MAPPRPGDAALEIGRDAPADRGYLRSVLRAGNARAGAYAEATLKEVREAMGGLL